MLLTWTMMMMSRGILQGENTLCVSQWGRRVGEVHRAYIGQCYTPAALLVNNSAFYCNSHHCPHYIRQWCNALLVNNSSFYCQNQYQCPQHILVTGDSWQVGFISKHCPIYAVFIVNIDCHSDIPSMPPFFVIFIFSYVFILAHQSSACLFTNVFVLRRVRLDPQETWRLLLPQPKTFLGQKGFNRYLGGHN